MRKTIIALSLLAPTTFLTSCYVASAPNSYYYASSYPSWQRSYNYGWGGYGWGNWRNTAWSGHRQNWFGHGAWGHHGGWGYAGRHGGGFHHR